jgi:hypothetical protein
MNAAAARPNKSREEQWMSNFLAVQASARPNKSREEQWMSNFLAVQAFYRKHQHLTIPDKTLSQWLTYQRLHAKTLNERQLTLLDSIKYNDSNLAGVREKDEENWRIKCEGLEKFVYDNGGVKGLPSHLRSWVNRQKRKLEENSLDPPKKQRLIAIGVDLSGYKERRCGDPREKKAEEVWYQNFEKLQQYREVQGNCNVPYRFAYDPPLGEWVSNQRKRYKQLKDRGREADDSRIKLLEDIGFEWTRKAQQSKLRNRSWKKVKTSSEEQLKNPLSTAEHWGALS